MSELKTIGRFVSELTWEDVPEQVRKETVLHIADSVAAALSAVGNAQVCSVADVWMKKSGGGSVSVWGNKGKTDVSTAVFLNALMGHTQEMDDVHTKSKTHIGTVVVPAAWSLSEYLQKSGRDCILAVICGYEVMSRIGMAFGVSAHRNRGWHVTATAGTFGAAAAGAKLLGLDEEKTMYALALAGAQSFGTWGFLGDGASCKVLNPARAAQVGLESALLAKAGMTGPEHILTAEDGGILKMMSDAPDVSLAVKDLGTVWQTLYMDNKPYPACRSTHCTIDAALELRKARSITPDQVDHVEVETYLVGYKQCGVSEGSLHPKTAVNAKFSTPYTVASALKNGEISIRSFRQEQILDPEVQDLLRRVTVKPAEEFTRVYPEHWGCRVIIYQKDGQICEKTVPDASGSVANPLKEEQIRTKAEALIREGCPDQVDAYIGELMNLEGSERIPEL